MAREKTTCAGDRGGVLTAAALAWIELMAISGHAITFESDGSRIICTEIVRGQHLELAHGPDARQALINAFCANTCVVPIEQPAEGGAA